MSHRVEITHRSRSRSDGRRVYASRIARREYRARIERSANATRDRRDIRQRTGISLSDLANVIQVDASRLSAFERHEVNDTDIGEVYLLLARTMRQLQANLSDALAHALSDRDRRGSEAFGYRLMSELIERHHRSRGMTSAEPVTDERLARLRDATGMDVRALSRLLMLKQDAIVDLQAVGVTLVERDAGQRIALVEQIVALAEEVLEPQGVHEFFTEKQPALGNRSASTAIEEGDGRDVYGELAGMYEGYAGL